MKRIWILLTLLAGGGGMYYVVSAGNYLLSYLSEPGNSHRGEYLQGAVLSLIFSSPFWIAVSVFAYPLRRTIPKRAYVALNIPSVLLIVGIVLQTIVPVIYYYFWTQ
ncbi:hypothetical protein WCE37_14670 [Luteimonas sp. MJ250]|uniref:hypothetical protein n=1 Tax=Luteimonas sp. MJ250 TaxID=3129236 RepID=UPI0031BA3138